MTRVLRYPRLSALSCITVMLCALGRDACVSAGLAGWAQVLLIITIALTCVCMALFSCRFFVDEVGIGVGFLLRVRRTAWEDVASFGLLCCNSRRRYFYGMYRGATDFINLIHRAPQCGSWGFVVPASRKLIRAVDQVLTDQERQVILLRYGLGGNSPQRQREVAQVTGISRSYVSRIEKKALQKLRQALE